MLKLLRAPIPNTEVRCKDVACAAHAPRRPNPLDLDDGALTRAHGDSDVVIAVAVQCSRCGSVLGSRFCGRSVSLVGFVSCCLPILYLSPVSGLHDPSIRSHFCDSTSLSVRFSSSAVAVNTSHLSRSVTRSVPSSPPLGLVILPFLYLY